MNIKNILDVKEEEKKKELEKEEASGIKKVTFQEEEPPKEEEKKTLTAAEEAKKREQDKLNISHASGYSEYQHEKEHERAEIEQYGRMWIWEGYFAENQHEAWMLVAKKLRHVNDHVLQDIEDAILLQGFKGTPVA